MNSAQKHIDCTNDNLMWRKLKAGDEHALAALFRQFYGAMFDYGIKLTQREELVKDAIQEVFAYIWQNRKSLSQANSVIAYLLVSLRRNLLTTLEKQKRMDKASKEMHQEYPNTAFPIEDLMIMNEENAAKKEKLKTALPQIPARLYEALYLKTYSGLSYNEIAEVMKITPGVARNYISEAFQRLRQIVDV
ncbi:MAG: sigma-70 family RNA polymerase sigma factor [Calditrichaeota bacterium]|nr:MAG: sigma-70 family RNA polymerase sigma factor [Calditrichota bacterium]